MLGFFQSLAEKIKPKKNKQPKLQNQLDEKLVFNLNKKKRPTFRQLKYLPRVLERGERYLVLSFLIIIIGALGFLGYQSVQTHLKLIPAPGGRYIEALVGVPRYINPILAQTNDVDQDLTRLVFSSLLKYDQNLNLVPDLATHYEINEDKTVYTFYLRQGVQFHDGKKLEADDIMFTVESIQNPDFKSPLAISFQGVEIVKVDDYTIQFLLQEPYAPFLGILTFGILPQHLWYNITPANANLAEYNLKPVGSGPWQFQSLTKDKSGGLKSYTFKKNPNYYGTQPYLEQLIFKFYPDFMQMAESLVNKNVLGISFLPKEYQESISSNKNFIYYYLSLPQYTAIFFNQEKNKVLQNKTVRLALTQAINKEEIVTEALGQIGEVIDGPILPGFVGYNPDIEKYQFDPSRANSLLDEAGWAKLETDVYYARRAEEELKKLTEEEAQAAEEEAQAAEESAKNSMTTEEVEKIADNNTAENETEKTAAESLIAEKNHQEIIAEKLAEELDPEQTFYRQKDNQILEITLTTVENPENVQVLKIIKRYWREIGIKVNLEIVVPEKIKQEVIKPRNYETLLYGEVVGADPDPYPFWHSSQNEDPGLNLAIFSNKEVDGVLEDARRIDDPESRRLKYRHFQNVLVAEVPAIFLYNPVYTYVLDQKIQGFLLNRLIRPADRFNNLPEWYLKTKWAWE